MGVDLNVWSNHQLKFNTLEKGIQEFEKKTAQTIKQWNYIKDEPIPKTRNVSQLEYYTDFNILQQNYTTWKEKGYCFLTTLDKKSYYTSKT